MKIKVNMFLSCFKACHQPDNMKIISKNLSFFLPPENSNYISIYVRPETMNNTFIKFHTYLVHDDREIMMMSNLPEN